MPLGLRECDGKSRASLDLRTAVPPGGGALISVADPQHSRLIETVADNLQRKRQITIVVAAAHCERRLSGEVERPHVGRPLVAEIWPKLAELRCRIGHRRQQNRVDTG